MNWTLEVVTVPVSDVAPAKAFYAEQLGFNVDHDTRVSEGIRVVQLTPPGSGCVDRLRRGDRPGHATGFPQGLAAGRFRHPRGILEMPCWSSIPGVRLVD